jgi:porin
MNIGENDDGNSFTFWGTQLGYRAEMPWGEGNYRLLLAGASRDFLDPTGTSEERRFAVGLSFDQQLGETFGAYLRFGWQDDSATVTYNSIYSGGINIRGQAWGRPADEIGLGYGYLPGGNEDLRSTHVAEVYYRLAINEYFALTADAQYMRDTAKSVDEPDGFVLGLRFAIEF